MSETKLHHAPPIPLVEGESRLQRLIKLLDHNRMDEPEEFTDEYSDETCPRFVALEIADDVTGSEYALWCYIDDNLARLAESLTGSDTNRDSFEIIDLDTLKYLGWTQTIKIDRPEA